MTTFTLHPPTAVQCPSWCAEPAGHPFDQLVDDGAEARSHGREFGADTDASADVLQLAVYRDGMERPDGSVEIRVWIDGNPAESHITTPEQARRLAAALIAAADLLEEVQA